jgi:uncharacterized repeat protein (TIGR04076 family)
MTQERGFRLEARVIRVKGVCNAGHCVGDALPVSARDTAGMCGYLYHAAFPFVVMLQFGGALPWSDDDSVELDCPDKENLVTLRLSRVRGSAGPN